LEAGRQKLDDTLARGDAVLPETSNQGQDLIREELNMLTNDFEQFDTDINELQNNLGEYLFPLSYSPSYNLNFFLKTIDKGMDVKFTNAFQLGHYLDLKHKKHLIL